MKRFLIIILFAATAAVVFIVAATVRRPAGDPALFLPDQLLVYLEHKNLADTVEDMGRQQLGRAVESIDFVRLALDLDIPLEKVELLRGIRDFMGSPKAALLFEELCSTRVALALLGDAQADDLKSHIHDNLLFFAEPKRHAALLESIAGLFTEDAALNTAQYGSHVIYRVPITRKMTLSFTADTNLVIAALQERTLRRALDRKDEKQIHLGENFFYALFRERFRTSRLFSYFSIQNIQKFLETLPGKDNMLQRDILEHLGNWNGFTAGGYGASVKDGYVQDTLLLHFNTNELNEGSKRFLAIAPQKNRHIDSIPASSSLYYWTNTFDPSTMWRMYASEGDMDATDMAEIEEMVGAMAGIPFTELLQILDNTFHVIIGKPSAEDFVPLPNFTVMLHLGDPAKAHAVMKNILRNGGIPHSNHSYRDYPFTYWGRHVQGGLQPVYTIYDNMLYVSSSVTIHRQVIDAVTDGGGIVSYENFEGVAATLLQPNNSVVFTQVQPLLATLENFVVWLQTMLSIQNRSTAYKSRKVIEGLILPLLDGLKMYSTLATRSYTEEGKIVIESYRARKDQHE